MPVSSYSPNLSVPYICTSGTHPTTGLFAGLQIYETNTGNTLYYQSATTGFTAPWNTEWGYIDTKKVTANQGSITTAVDVTGLSSTQTYVANRHNRVHVEVLLQTTVADDVVGIILMVDGSQVEVSNIDCRVANQAFSAEINWEIDGLSAGSHTIKVQAQRVAGTGTITMVANATAPALLLIEDIGPNGAPA